MYNYYCIRPIWLVTAKLNSALLLLIILGPDLHTVGEHLSDYSHHACLNTNVSRTKCNKPTFLQQIDTDLCSAQWHSCIWAFLCLFILQLFMMCINHWAAETFSVYINNENHVSYLKWTLPWISPAPATVSTPLTRWENGFVKVTVAVCSLLGTMGSSSAIWRRNLCQWTLKIPLNYPPQISESISIHPICFPRLVAEATWCLKCVKSNRRCIFFLLCCAIKSDT